MPPDASFAFTKLIVRDLEGLAAMITALDLVISVGNTTVHLAGSLGQEAWSLVAANPSWRWMESGDRVPWYESVRRPWSVTNAGGSRRSSTLAEWASRSSFAFTLFCSV